MPNLVGYNTFKKNVFKKSKDKKQDKQIAKIKKHISSTELKYSLKDRAQNDMSATVGNQYDVFPLAAGDDVFHRQGRQIKPIKLSMQWYFVNASAADINEARGLLVRTNKPNGSMSILELLNYTASALRGNWHPAYVKIRTKDRFITSGADYEILYDTGLIRLAPNTAASTYSSNRTIKKVKYLSARKPVHYTGTNAADVGPGNIAWITFANSTDVKEGGSITGYFIDD